MANEDGRPGSRRGRLVGVVDVGVRRVDFGYFVRPAEETGTGTPRVEPVLGYLVEHPDGAAAARHRDGRGTRRSTSTTGRGADPCRRALADAGAQADDVRWSSTATCTSTTAAATPRSPAGRWWPSARELAGRARGPTTRCPSWSTSPACGTRSSTARPRCCPASSWSPRPGTPPVTSRWWSGGRTAWSWCSRVRATTRPPRTAPTPSRGEPAREGHPQPLPVPPAWIDRLQRTRPRRRVLRPRPRRLAPVTKDQPST